MVKVGNLASAVVPTATERALVANCLRPKHFTLGILLIILFVPPALIRVYRIHAPGQLVEREYTSAVFARAFYFDHAAVEAWRVDMAHTVAGAQPILEPPLTELLVAFMYRVAGHEALYLARLLTSAFWLAGSFWLFLLVRQLLSTTAALLAMAYCLFVPGGVLVSRSFQPDARMMIFLASLLAMVRYFHRPSLRRLWQAAVLAGLTLLVRHLVVFAIYMAFTSMSIAQRRSVRGLVNAPFITFCLVSLILLFAYYGHGLFIAGYLRWKIGSSFLPVLYVRLEFWREWFFLALDEGGSAPLTRSNIGRGTAAGPGQGAPNRPNLRLYSLWTGTHLPHPHARLLPRTIEPHGRYRRRAGLRRRCAPPAACGGALVAPARGGCHGSVGVGEPKLGPAKAARS